jgi:hypothetical protein
VPDITVTSPRSASRTNAVIGSRGDLGGGEDHGRAGSGTGGALQERLAAGALVGRGL